MKRHLIIFLVSVTLSVIPLYVQLSGCSLDRALLAATYSDLAAINEVIENFKNAEISEVGALGLQNAIVDKGYLRKWPVDKWGNSYRLIETNNKPFVYSSGENGLDEAGEVDDVSLRDRGFECEKFGIDCNYHVVLGFLAYVSAFLLLINILIWVISIPTRYIHQRFKL